MLYIIRAQRYMCLFSTFYWVSGQLSRHSYELDGQGSNPGRGYGFSLLHNIQTGSRAHPNYPMDIGGEFSGVIAVPLPPSSAEVKLYPNTHPYAFVTLHLIRHWGNFSRTGSP